MGTGVLVVDSDCTIRFWNLAMENMTGYTADEVIGRPCGFLRCTQTGPALSGGHCNPVNAVCREPRQCVLHRKDGSTVPVLRHGSLVDTGDGASVVVETITDISVLQDPIAEHFRLRGKIPGPGDDADAPRLIGNSHAMTELYSLVAKAAASMSTVLVTGETGTGKELVASAIHYNSQRRDGPFIKVNCSALPEGLLESELFGHVRGAFTGAVRDKIGRFEAADGGTIFLDEIGDVSPLIQLKLLRVLQEHTFERVGESIPRKTDVRVLAATNRDLQERISQGLFREDLYFRLKVFPINVPSLRRRKEDIGMLVDHFIVRFNRRTGKQITGLAQDARRMIMDYCWPGNIRELENAIEHAFVTSPGGLIGIFDLPQDIRRVDFETRCREKPSDSRKIEISSRRITKESIIQALEKTNWNRGQAARILGIDRTTLWRRMKKAGIN